MTLDTAYGFQENVPQMTEKLVGYFDTSLHVSFKALHFPSYEKATEIDRAIFKQEVRESNFVFAGPGSPSYAVNQWLPLRVSEDLRAVLDAGGTLCFSSAAAATLGKFSPPIYEIYKVGSGLYWNDGLDLLANYGLSCVVIPHFDNQEGSNYDTSCCYLGLRRLELMETMLPDNTATLGVDEHTALILDYEEDTLRVLGRSNGYWRLNGTIRVLENGSTTPLEKLRASDATVPRTVRADDAPRVSTPDDLAQRVLAGGNDAVEALAHLVRLSEVSAEGFIDPKSLVDGVLTVRENARVAGQYDLADQLRDALVRAGIEIHDGPEGSRWTLKSST